MPSVFRDRCSACAAQRTRPGVMLARSAPRARSGMARSGPGGRTGLDKGSQPGSKWSSSGPSAHPDAGVDDDMDWRKRERFIRTRRRGFDCSGVCRVWHHGPSNHFSQTSALSPERVFCHRQQTPSPANANGSDSIGHEPSCLGRETASEAGDVQSAADNNTGRCAGGPFSANGVIESADGAEGHEDAYPIVARDRPDAGAALIASLREGEVQA
jgi:hypothetical protein